MNLEFWPEIAARHKRERVELLCSVLNHYTLYEAAAILGTKHETLRTYAINHNISYRKKGWPSKDGRGNEQGKNEGAYCS